MSDVRKTAEIWNAEFGLVPLDTKLWIGYPEWATEEISETEFLRRMMRYLVGCFGKGVVLLGPKWRAVESGEDLTFEHFNGSSWVVKQTIPGA